MQGEYVEWIQLAQGRAEYLAVVHTTENICVQRKVNTSWLDEWLPASQEGSCSTNSLYRG
jgi:hypothetical protein